MANKVVTNVDIYSIALANEELQDDTVLFAAADTFVKGTIMARKLVSDTVPVTPDVGNTGTFTLAVVANAAKTLKAGTWTLVAGTLSSGLGPWTLTDPEGAAQTVTTAGGVNTDDLNFANLGLTVTVTDPGSGTEFATGDSATFVVSAQSGTPLVPFSPTGVNGAQTPKALMTYEITKSGSGSLAVRALVKGKVNKSRLVIDEDGDGDNVTAVIVDQLNDVGIVAVPVQQLAVLDNQ